MAEPGKLSAAKEYELQRDAKFYANGLLTPDDHSRLVANIDNIARVANIPREYIFTPLSAHCGPVELAWVTAFRKPELAESGGLAYIGNPDKKLEARFKAIVGCFIRNYIDASFQTVQAVLEDLKDSSPPRCQVLVIPNLYVGKAKGGALQDWHISMLYDLLLNRLSAGQKTIVYISSMEHLRNEHGPLLANHIEANYQGIGL